MPRDSLNVHAMLPRSRANGPGHRFVLWLQGCSLGCPGCFNPDTHSVEPRLVLPVDEVVRRITGERGIDGVTVSGGEPFQQPHGLLGLLRLLRPSRSPRGVPGSTSLSVLVFSGYAIEEILAQALGPEILERVDVLIDGRYVEERRIDGHLRGSANQRAHFLTDRYRPGDLVGLPRAEVVVDAAGGVVGTGFEPEVLRPLRRATT